MSRYVDESWATPFPLAASGGRGGKDGDGSHHVVVPDGVGWVSKLLCALLSGDRMTSVRRGWPASDWISIYI